MKLARIRLSPGEISYFEEGGGDPLLFLHGAIATAEAYTPLLTLLSRRYHVVAPIHPGHGTSFVVPHWWKLNNYVLFYQDFLAEIGFSPKNLIGHSFGGTLALLLAAQGVGKHVVAMDTPGWPFYFNHKDYVSKLAAEARENPRGNTNLRELQNPSAVARSIFQTIVRHPGDISVFSKFAPKYNVASLVKKISIPVNLFWGEADTIIPVTIGKKLEAVIPGAQLTVFPGLGHNFSLIYPEFTFEELVKVIG